MNIDKELDVRGLNCPLPVLRTKKAMNGMATGGILKVTATDPASLQDLQAFANQTGHELLESAEAGGEYIFILRKH